MNTDPVPPASATLAPWPSHPVFPIAETVPRGPGAVKGAPIGAAEGTLDGEDHFGTIEEGENTATIPGAVVGPVNRNYRDPLQKVSIGVSSLILRRHRSLKH